jgi:hypothetical protein
VVERAGRAGGFRGPAPRGGTWLGVPSAAQESRP